MLSFTTRGNFIDFKYTEDVVPYQVHNVITLHNTSKCITWGYGENETHIDFKIDDITYNEIPITSIYFDGVVMSAQSDFKTNIEAMFPGLAGGSGSPGGSDKQMQYNNAGSFGGISNGDAGQVLTSNGAGSAPSFQAGGGSSYLVYSGNLNQSGTSAPTCTPNQDTLTGDITFAYSSPGVFSLESTLEEFADAAKLEIFYPSIVEPAGSFVIISRQSSTSIDIKTYEAQGDGTYSLANGYLTNWPFEIRVYP